jgi:serine protease Do
MAVAGFGEIAEQLRRCTVLIRAGTMVSRGGVGSGVIWSPDGLIVTNAHVAQKRNLTVQLWDGREFGAVIAKRDPQRDLATLHIAATDLEAASITDSSQLRAGELAVAIGNPLGFIGALAMGVIHRVGPVPGLGSGSWVQADVRLAPGNSGGPLADVRGRVIGINTMVAGRLALAIPSNIVKDFLAGESGRAWLGVVVRPVQVPDVSGQAKAHRFGVLLLEVERDSPAAQASLLAGDILLGAEGAPFCSVEDFSRSLRENKARLLRLEFLRGDYSRVRRVAVLLQLANARGAAAA